LEMKKETIKELRRKGVFSLFLLPFLLSFGGVFSYADTGEEYAVKAAFVLNFAKFTQWPEDSFASPDSFSLCVIGDNSVKRGFQTIDGKKAGNRSLHVNFLAEIDDLDRCNMLFVGGDVDRVSLLRIFASVKGEHVLTIGEMKNFASDGGVINFISKNKKLRFEINRETADQQKIKISSRLLNLAIIVNGNE
jgi:hypothetical protein